MNTEYAIINHNGQSQEIEHVRKVSPNVGGAILPHAFRIEAICLQERCSDR